MASQGFHPARSNPPARAPINRKDPKTVIRSSRGGAMVHSLRTSHRRLPPLQTGRADFPHPAYPRTLRSKACADRCRLGRRTETLPRNEVGRSLFWEQCSMCILTLLHVESLAGPLRSAGITPLQRYYEPLRLPIEPPRGYGFPHSLTLGLCAKRHSNGSLRFLAILSASAVPSHPGEPGRCRRSLLHGR